MTNERVNRLFELWTKDHKSWSAMIEDHEYWDLYFEWRRVERPDVVRAFDQWEIKRFGAPFDPPIGYRKAAERYSDQMARVALGEAVPG